MYLVASTLQNILFKHLTHDSTAMHHERYDVAGKVTAQGK